MLLWCNCLMWFIAQAHGWESNFLNREWRFLNPRHPDLFVRHCSSLVWLFTDLTLHSGTWVPIRSHYSKEKASLTYPNWRNCLFASNKLRIDFNLVTCSGRRLHGNRLTSIGSGVFTGLKSLTELFVLIYLLSWLPGARVTTSSPRDLSQNKITSIKGGDFSGLASLKILFGTFQLFPIYCCKYWNC